MGRSAGRSEQRAEAGREPGDAGHRPPGIRTGIRLRVRCSANPANKLNAAFVLELSVAARCSRTNAAFSWLGVGEFGFEAGRMLDLGHDRATHRHHR